ncbi:CHAT domain-containing protein [Suillus ampliporus]|nr:CHAT domain-containing protein [Suillus ampliporus]
MLGHGKVIGRLELSWDELFNHGDEPFDLSFPVIDDICPSLTLKVAFLHACGHDDGALFDPIIECEIARRTDAGHTRISKYMKSKSGVSHLNGAVNYFQWVVAQCPVGHPDCAAAITNLAWACLQGYIRKDLRDINTSLFRDALALRPQGHPDHPLSVFYLTEVLKWCYKYQVTTPGRAHIREAAQLYDKLLPLCPEGTYLRKIAVGANGVDYVIRKCNNLPTDTSNEGIHLRRIVLRLCPVGQQCRLSALDELSWALCGRFEESGSIVDIDESIQLRREIISLCPEGHHARDTYLNNLAYSLSCRFDHQGKPHDLDEAISLYEDALHLCRAGYKRRGATLDNLGGVLRDRFEERHDINDINKAISLHREALTLCPPRHPKCGTTLNNLALALTSRYDELDATKRATTLNNLALALTSRYDELDAKEDLNEAINLYREALQLEQPGHPCRHLTLSNLSGALCSRFTQTRNIEHVEEAIGLCTESLAALPALHPDKWCSYDWLWDAYLSRYRVQHNPADLSLAVESFRLASRQPTQGFPNRIQTALQWVDKAEDYQHESTLEAYHMCLDLFDHHVMTRSSIIARRNAATAFHSAQSLSVNAASCAIRRNNLQQAVELEERGRGQQWSLASRLRTPLDDLKSVSLPLAHKFSEISKRLSDAQGSTVSTDRAAADQAAIEYRILTIEWEAALAEIRNLHGFSRFLLPPSYEDLQAAACHGPVIILIASEYSCNAIIVPTSGVPHHVPFSFALANLEMLKEDFARVIRQAALMGPTDPRTELRVLLRRVWDEIMLPIVYVLQRDLKLQRHSRIWLCPTAAFTSIPLHAAHPSRTKADRSGREPCLEDIYICSYTPTLSALIRARQTMKVHATPSFVAIGQAEPGAGQGKPLNSVDSELELVRELVPVQVKFTQLSGEDATQAGALEALRRNTWVHLACHGKQDRDQPYYSHFAMRDRPLTLLDIMENDAPQAEFAFLSACHTAVGDEQTPDEVIHLAAGLQFSGFKSVIGTLWVVDDAVAKHVVEAFYENMFKDVEDGVIDCRKAASALNAATYAVKKKVPLEQRIVFIHIGV